MDHLHTQVLTLLAGAHNRALQNLSLTLTPPLNPICSPQVQTLMAHNRSLQRKMGELAHAVAALTRIKTQVVDRGGKFFLGVGPPFHRHFKGKPYESSRMARETVSNSHRRSFILVGADRLQN